MADKVSTLNMARPVVVVGSPIERAKAAMVMIHGRGASASDILSNAAALNDPDFTYLAPEAPGHIWYPQPFQATLADNEPALSASLALISEILAYLTPLGLPPEKVILLGFSQGASLSLEYVARHARRYGGVVGFSGSLIGPDGMPRADGGSLAGSAVFLGCSDADPYIPKHRVEQSAEQLRRLGGTVTLRLYPNMAHTINTDELGFVRELMTVVKATAAAD